MIEVGELREALVGEKKSTYRSFTCFHGTPLDANDCKTYYHPLLMIVIDAGVLTENRFKDGKPAVFIGEDGIFYAWSDIAEGDTQCLLQPLSDTTHELGVKMSP